VVTIPSELRGDFVWVFKISGLKTVESSEQKELLVTQSDATTEPIKESNGALILLAETSIHEKLILESKGPNQSMSIGGWSDSQNSLSWDFSLEASGIYDIQILNAGSETSLKLEVGRESTVSKLNARKGFGDYQWQSLGKLALASGKIKMSLIPADAKTWKAINVSQVKLIPVKN
jgi:hypothetical protein